MSHDHTPMDRRSFMQVGAACGLSLGEVLRHEAHTGAANLIKPPAKAKAVIQIYLPGGIAHQEFVDPKPAAPREYRGEMDSIPTKLAGVRFNELMKETAKIADKITVIRSFTHAEVDHDRGTHNMLTGYRPSPALVYPSIGSIVSHEVGPRNELPGYVCIPTPFSQYNGPGYLSTAHGPFSIGADPGRRGFKVRDLNLPEGVDKERFMKRRNMLQAVDQHFRDLEKSDQVASTDEFYKRAYAMLSSSKAREAFNMKAESSSTLRKYGGRYGARFLLARRLVENGARFVSLSYANWDTHAFHFLRMSRQMPALDRAFAALISDLDERGLLDSTIVVLCSEFGRTPKVNGMAGRDHWPRVFSGIVAGGGFTRGAVYGASDKLADTVAEDPLSPEDFAATIYHQLGIDHNKRLMSPGDRPVAIVYNGKVVHKLLG